jgi:hypothetical protein
MVSGVRMGRGYLVHFYEEFGHAEEVGDCFFDVFYAFDEEVVYCLGGGD